MRELAVHIVGVVVTALGLYLFFTQEKVGAGVHSEREAGATIWKIQATGPSTLILVVIGLVVFLFPFWLGYDDPVAAPPTTSTSTTTTTIVAPTTTTAYLPTTTSCNREDQALCGSELPDDEFDPDLLVGLPETPYDYDIYYDEETCGWDVIEWYHTQEGYSDILGWQVQVEWYDGAGENSDIPNVLIYDTVADQFALTYGNYPALCYWDFVDPEYNAAILGDGATGFIYFIWVYPYNETGFSLNPLYVEYYDYSG